MKEADDMTSLNRVVDLARQEVWEKVDGLLPQHADQQEFYAWARENFGNLDPNLRDLAASIFEQTELPLDDGVIEGLFGLVGETDEENPYPSFRAACALAKRHEDERVSGRIDEVRSKLKSFVEDKDVAEIAKGHLEKIGQSKNS